jgi:hypothetical protein
MASFFDFVGVILEGLDGRVSSVDLLAQALANLLEVLHGVDGGRVEASRWVYECHERRTWSWQPFQFNFSESYSTCKQGRGVKRVRWWLRLPK